MGASTENRTWLAFQHISSRMTKKKNVHDNGKTKVEHMVNDNKMSGGNNSSVRSTVNRLNGYSLTTLINIHVVQNVYSVGLSNF